MIWGSPALAQSTAKVKTNVKIEVREDILTKEEQVLLKALHLHDQGFLYTGRVKRYVAIDAKGTETPIRNEIMFEADGGFIISQGQKTENVSYEVAFTQSNLSSLLVTYSYSAGTAFNVDATALVNSKGVVQQEFSCGTESCGFDRAGGSRTIAKRGR
jgi:hypothetical protein